jgi:small subunit ribosomal protein S16
VKLLIPITYHLLPITNFGGEKLVSNQIDAHGREEKPFISRGRQREIVEARWGILENVGTYNPTRNPAEVNLKLDRIQYWVERGAQPTDTVRQLIKSQSKTPPAEV